jgi:hypothetical protein
LRRQSNTAQLLLLDEGLPQDGPATPDTSTTFIGNLSLPVHRWFRYTAGFSAEWVRDTITAERAAGRDTVLDPFAGSGTALLEGEWCGACAYGVESHPFVSRVAQAKLHWRVPITDFLHYAFHVLEEARSHDTCTDHYPALIVQCYPTETLRRLDAIRRSWQDKADGSPCSELTWLTLVSVLRECASVNVAQCTYVLPDRMKDKVADPFAAFHARTRQMAHDMTVRQRLPHGPPSTLYCADARTCAPLPDASVELVITSPPYANNYDYADATRLELSFFGHVNGWGDLQEYVRRHLVRSCSQHVGGIVRTTDALVNDPAVALIADELHTVVAALLVERENHGGKKNYHTMIAAYFNDMARVWTSLRRVTAPGGRACFVIGDSAPYGVYVPVDRWLGDLAVAAGFERYRFEKTRDRNIKWKNRKHRVPLHEGRLWVEG